MNRPTALVAQRIEEIRDVVEPQDGLTTSEIHAALTLSPSLQATRRTLRRMAAMGLVDSERRLVATPGCFSMTRRTVWWAADPFAVWFATFKQRNRSRISPAWLTLAGQLTRAGWDACAQHHEEA